MNNDHHRTSTTFGTSSWRWSDPCSSGGVVVPKESVELNAKSVSLPHPRSHPTWENGAY
jgi:hypothetical protein